MSAIPPDHLAYKRCREHLTTLAPKPEVAYGVTIALLLQTLQETGLTIKDEDAKKLLAFSTLKIDLETESRIPINSATHVNNLVNALLDTLENGDAGLSAEAIDRLSKYVIEPTNRTSGVLTDNINTNEVYDIRMAPKANDLSDQVMDLVERLGNGGWYVDKRAWDHLLIYIPKYQKLKKRFKRFKRFFSKI